MNAKRRESRAAGLLRLAHAREVNEAVGEAMDAERPRFERLADPESAPRVVSAFNLFQTPEPLAALMVERLGERRRVLEPSAGLGRLYRAVRQTGGASVVLVEIAPDCCAELYRDTESDYNAKLIQADFLSCDAARLGGLFDGVIMNPPFSHRKESRHVRHAFDMLAPGGRLVAVMSTGPFNRSYKTDAAFRQWLGDVGGVREDLPPNSFKESGTGVCTCLVIIDKD